MNIQEFKKIIHVRRFITNEIISYVLNSHDISLDDEEDFSDLEDSILEHLLKIFEKD